MKDHLKPYAIRRLGSAMLALGALSLASAQFRPDPDIFDAAQNGAGGSVEDLVDGPYNTDPLGGQIVVVDESNLPPIQINLPGIPGIGNGRFPGGIPGARGQSAGASNSGGIPILAGGSAGSSSSQSTPFPGQMPQSSQQSQGSESSDGPMPKTQSQQGGAPSSISSQLPEAPPEQGIGDEGAQIDPNGELTASEESSESNDSEQSNQGRSGSKQAASSTENNEGDGQAMPENIGGSQGSKRERGTIEDVAVPTSL